MLLHLSSPFPNPCLRVRSTGDYIPSNLVLLDAHSGQSFFCPEGGAAVGAIRDSASLVTAIARNRTYVIDPLGNLFMRCPKDVDVKGIVKDMERLLKTSQIG
jgi:hypothetical protein